MVAPAVISSRNRDVMKIRILYFATFRDLAGVREENLSIPEGATIEILQDHLAKLHPPIEDGLATAVFAINREFAFSDDLIRDGDEVAIFPPVSGGMDGPSIIVKIVQEPLDLNAVLELIIRPTTGAACVFTGMVRGLTTRGKEQETAYLEYEAYQPMAEDKLKQVAIEIKERWNSIEGIAILQRVGKFMPGTPTVAVACSASHRDSGVFEAARYGIDRLKEIVPVWKKEVSSNGEEWVEGEYLPGKEDQGP
jgi:molybdopterin converting factor subunit 1